LSETLRSQCLKPLLQQIIIVCRVMFCVSCRRLFAWSRDKLWMTGTNRFVQWL